MGNDGVIEGAVIVELGPQRVERGWIDANGHMNVGYFAIAFDRAIDDMLEHLGLGPSYRRSTDCTTFAVESHFRYLRELLLDAPLRLTGELLGFDAKRIHTFYRMYHAEEGYLAATCEWLNLHVDLTRRKSAPLPPEIAARLESALAARGATPWPEEASRAIRVPWVPSPERFPEGVG